MAQNPTTAKTATTNNDKCFRNAKLIDHLDCKYNLHLAYPQTEDDKILEFWANRDPRQSNGWIVLMENNDKIAKVDRVGPTDYWIEIIDDVEKW